ncbi:MAG: penicillin-binding protein activator LpoB [Candidatus Fermentibacteraceae bacterium]|nr:penicillin-binding protein activator LpoB [Candidatus Fermentibacteraceae bacterium]MBN2607769.1 penicillin-binding protein activator LpoB [Candidatus Fermentibacteraceae bacterium]
MNTILRILAVAALAAVMTGCGGREVTRTDPDTVTDLSGYWNDTDARMVADSMVAQCLGGRWLDDFATSRDSRPPTPVIVVGGIYNESSEHINTNLFMNEIERSLLESGDVQIAAGGTSRQEIRTERYDQSIFASPETAAEFGREIGADYVMTGDIGSIVDEEGGTRSIYYQISLELIDVETALKTWMGSLEIKKIIEW